MIYYALETLGSSDLKRLGPHPSKIKVGKIPKFKSKEKFREWCVNPKTKHTFLTLTEPLNPHLRVSGTNPAYKLHGFVGDYDHDRLAKASYEEIINYIDNKDLGSWSPTWIHRTYSGKIRLVWEFETPLFIDSQNLSDKIMDALLVATKSRTIIKQGGWDECSKNPAMMWEIGSDWQKLQGGKVPKASLEALFFEVAKKTGGPKGKVTIPLEVVADKVHEMFPNKWVGEFEVGCRGPLFWIDDGIDRSGAVVQEGGMWAYSTRSNKSFMSWTEIFGEKFVSEYRENQLNEAIDDTWYDGKKYWTKDGRGVWSPIVKEDFMVRLRLAGFTHKARKQNDPASQIDEVLAYVQDNRRIHGAAPFLFDHNEVVEKGPKRYINTHAHLRVMDPADSGEISLWPNLHEWFTHWMEFPESIHYLYTWMRRFYKGCLEGKPNLGHSVIIAGGADQGKSLFSTFLLPKIFSGGADCGPYMMGEESFNDELTQSPVWYIDDNSSSSNTAQHRRFSEMLKKLSATPKVTARAMYSSPVDLDRKGRIILTTNTDADSLAILPNLDGTILDKLMIFKLGTVSPWFAYLSSYEIESTIKKELPHFLRWLLDYEPPQEIIEGASGRYGMHVFHHPDVVSVAKDLSPDQRDWEMLQFWWQQYDSDEWVGNVSALIGELNMYETLQPLTRTLNKVVFGRTMSKFASQYPNKVRKAMANGTVQYTLELDDYDN